MLILHQHLFLTAIQQRPLISTPNPGYIVPTSILTEGHLWAGQQHCTQILPAQKVKAAINTLLLPLLQSHPNLTLGSPAA
jgi:hypothetical protein